MSTLKMTGRYAFILFLLIGIRSQSNANDTDLNVPLMLNSEDLISVYLDCSHCDNHYIRQNIPFVNYVRDRELADLHLLITIHFAGSSGDNYELSFIGQKRFQGRNNNFRYWADSNNTADDTRRELTEMIKLGLAPYLASTSIGSHLVLTLDTAKFIEKDQQYDPFKSWIFEAYAGSNFSFESERDNLTARYGFYANKTTDDIKIQLRPLFNYRRLRYDTDKGTITRTSYRNGFDGYLIKSLNNHWSAGLFLNSLSSTFHNIKFNVELSPGIEYSIFPYQEATRKAVTVSYQLGIGYHYYLEETIFNQTEEMLWGHKLNASIRFQQPWGNLRGGINGSHYFHDFRSNRIDIFSSLNLRLFSGFALNISSSFNLINDQVALSKENLSLEDILLQQRRQSTNYQLEGSLGFSYTFGSKFTNVYNTRFN